MAFKGPPSWNHKNQINIFGFKRYALSNFPKYFLYFLKDKLKLNFFPRNFTFSKALRCKSNSHDSKDQTTFLSFVDILKNVSN